MPHPASPTEQALPAAFDIPGGPRSDPSHSRHVYGRDSAGTSIRPSARWQRRSRRSSRHSVLNMPLRLQNLTSLTFPGVHLFPATRTGPPALDAGNSAPSEMKNRRAGPFDIPPPRLAKMPDPVPRIAIAPKSSAPRDPTGCFCECRWLSPQKPGPPRSLAHRQTMPSGAPGINPHLYIIFVTFERESPARCRKARAVFRDRQPAPRTQQSQDDSRSFMRGIG